MTAPTSAGDPLRITGIETLVVDAGLRNWIFVKVLTSTDGLYGWGEATLNWKTRAVVGAVEDLGPTIVDLDPRDVVQCTRTMRRQSYYNLGIIGMTAVSGIEQALWDIAGKNLGQPVWRLLGGRVRDRVRVYAHLGLGEMDAVYSAFDAGQVRKQAQEVVALGYDALKVVIVPFSGHLARASQLRLVDSLMSTLRDAVGDDVDLMVDFHGRPGSTAAALAYIEVLVPYRPLFCEEPVQPGDTAALRDVTQRAGCAIATGERLVGLREFLPVLAGKAAHVVQPDISHTGGLWESKLIASVAESELIGVAPHNPNGPVAGAAALHFDVSTPNFVIQEEMSGAVPWYADVFETPMRRTGSYWEVPHSAGLGVEINEAEAAKHPYHDEKHASAQAYLADGTVVDW